MERFNYEDKKLLAKKNIPLEYADLFDPMFMAFDITFLLKYGANFETANSFSRFFNLFDILKLCNKQISPFIAENYLVYNKHNCHENDSNVYSNNYCKCGEKLSHATVDEISSFLDKGINPQEFRKRILIEDDSWFCRNFDDVTKFLNTFYPLSYVRHEQRLRNKDGSKTGKFYIDKGKLIILDNDDLSILSRFNFNADDVSKYFPLASLNIGYGASRIDLLNLIKAGIKPETLRSTVSQLEDILGGEFPIINVKNRESFEIKHNIGHGLGIPINDIIWVIKNKVPLEKIREYKSHHVLIEIEYERILCDPRRTIARRFIWSIRKLLARFRAPMDIRDDYFKDDSSMQELVQDEELIDINLSNLKREGLKFNILPENEEEVREAILRYGRDVNKYHSINISKSPISTGSNAFIIRYEFQYNGETVRIATKYAPINLQEREFKCLYLKPKSKNVINHLFFVGGSTIGIPNEGINLDYIYGSTLEQLLDQENKILTPKMTIKYSAGIFNGLLELKASNNTYHRDLWLWNIIIDDIKDEAIIIDLGCAAYDEYIYSGSDAGRIYTITDCNRRYGGENDLQSLGQIIYKMATGKHLFHSSIDKSTHLIPDEIKAERERIYADGSLLESRLKQVDEKITDKTLAEIINICLTAKGNDNDYNLLEQRFK